MDERVLGAGRVGLPRGLVVGRLLERQRAGELSTRHVVAVAETVGVSERTVWRWLEQANATGRVEPGVRQGYAVSDEVWELLGEAGETSRSCGAGCWPVRAGTAGCRFRRCRR